MYHLTLCAAPYSGEPRGPSPSPIPRTGWASLKKASPCRAANDRKDKLPELEQFGPLNSKSYFPRTTEPCMGNLCAEGPARGWVRPFFVFGPLNDLNWLQPREGPYFF